MKRTGLGRYPRYEVGDKVRIWKILKNPIGKILGIDEKAVPITYTIQYEYFQGGWYTEVFQEDDLTLYEKAHDWECNCKSVSGLHLRWCNRSNF